MIPGYECENYLAHHGILGMKWGVRRYQNSDGSLTEEGRKHYGVGPERNSKEAERAKTKTTRAERKARAKAQKQAKKDAKEAEEKKRSHEDTLKYLRDHPKQIYRHRHEVTEEDLAKLVKEIEFDRKLKDIRDEEVRRGWKKAKEISDNIGTIKNLTNNAKDLFNAGLDISNWLIDTGRSSGTRSMKIGDKPEKQEEDRSDIQRIVRSGSRQEVLANIPNLTSNELKDAMARLNYEDQLKNPKEKKDK